MQIPSFRRATNPDEESAVLAALRSGLIAAGPDIELFERELAETVGAGDAAAVSSGFAALHLALLALGIGVGDEVIMPCVSTCAAIRNATLAVGAAPVFADTSARDFNLATDAVAQRISTRTRAIIAPHHTGIPCRIDELNAFGIPVIEDCAQAIGASIDGKPVGSLSMLSVFSFYATKVMTTIDGGAVVSDRADLIDRVRDLRYYAGRWDAKARYNYKMQNIGAGIGRVELRNLRSSLERRRWIGEIYKKVLLDHGAPADAPLHQHAGAIYFRFAFRVPEPAHALLRESFESRGVPCSPEMGFLTDTALAFPNAARLAAMVLTLPTYPALTDDEVEYVASTLKHVLLEQRIDWY